MLGKKSSLTEVQRDQTYRPRRPILSASVGVGETLLYSSRIQTTCLRKHNKPSQWSYLAATVAGAFS